MKKVLFFMLSILLSDAVLAFSFAYPIENNSQYILDRGVVRANFGEVAGTLSSPVILEHGQANLFINAEGTWRGLIVFTYHIENGHHDFDKTITAYYDPVAKKPAYIYCPKYSGLHCEVTASSFVMNNDAPML